MTRPDAAGEPEGSALMAGERADGDGEARSCTHAHVVRRT